MFFSDDLLTRKTGTFGVIWLAATLGPRSKKINRKDLSGIDLLKTCELIAEPPQPMALRLSGALLVGVARVYNQTYEIFYSDITQFHTALRRSTAEATSLHVIGAASSTDLSGDGRSNYQQITFTGMDMAQQAGLDLEYSFRYINWMDPFGQRKRRRGTSKLTSLESQELAVVEQGDSDEDSEDESISGSEVPVRRTKRSKVDSSPIMIPSYTHKAQAGTSDGLGDSLHDLDFPPDMQIDLELESLNGMNEDSVHPTAGVAPASPLQDGTQLPPSQNPVWVESTQLDDVLAMDSGLDEDGEDRRRDRSVPEAEEEHRQEGITKVRRSKNIKMDEHIELADGLTDGVLYARLMEQESLSAREKEKIKASEHQAELLVNGAGEWMKFHHPELKEMFSRITRAKAWRWETDIKLHKRGGVVPGEGFPRVEQPDEDHQMDPNHYISNDLAMDAVMDGYEEFAGGIDMNRQRAGSELPTVRRRGQSNDFTYSGTLPWQSFAFVNPYDEEGHQGVDSTVTPSTHRLSLMTPQEYRIRLRSGQGSAWSQDLGSRRGRTGSMSGSVVGRGGIDNAVMLVGDESDDIELPPDEMQFGISESQADRRGSVPDAFKPEMLANLETQCRDFLSFVEQQMPVGKTEFLLLDDLVPRNMSRRIAASAFYNCLTLATKHCLVLRQPDHFGPIALRLAA